MEDLNVRILQLPPMRVASAYGFGANPEEFAWGTLLEWARASGLLHAEPASNFFGFNNPNPSAGSLNYGYEQWMTVGPDVADGTGVTIKEFPGGLYAVARCEGLLTITDTWHRLATWCEGQPVRHGAASVAGGMLHPGCCPSPGLHLRSVPADCGIGQVLLWRRRCLTRLRIKQVNEVSGGERQRQYGPRK